ncbi:hypothetical protein GTA08_BOTSDO12314 [Botryosphaeria dothidea]|uniref:Uncharacterized protein n=1 Tax=Botryosphaeria dothidea TaxID=55169 RepID=A0A8H4J340_9PEZI|nr:hypothetical protein GTA08_BOTSDO12314 [Botryosphaeria dothidea]
MKLSTIAAASATLAAPAALAAPAQRRAASSSIEKRETETTNANKFVNSADSMAVLQKRQPAAEYRDADTVVVERDWKSSMAEPQMEHKPVTDPFGFIQCNPQ